MAKRMWMCGLLVLGMAFSAWGATVAFDPNLLNATRWSLKTAYSGSGRDADGSWSDRGATMVFLTFNADKSFAVEYYLGNDPETLFEGQWTCDAKGKVGLTATPDTLVDWFMRGLTEDWEDVVLDQASVLTKGSFKGTVKRKGTILTLKLSGMTQVTANYECMKWVYDRKNDEWNQVPVQVKGLDKNVFTMSGQFDDTSATGMQAKIYHFTNMLVTEKIKKIVDKSTMSFDLTLQPENACFGQFTMDFSDGPLTGFYIVNGKNTLLYMNEPTVEDVAKPVSLAYLNSILGADTLSMYDYGNSWDVDEDVSTVVLSENAKLKTAKLAGKLAFEVDCWYEDEIEVKGTITYAGTGALVP